MKTLIFDFDGTIADSFDTMLDIFKELTGRQLSKQEVSRLRGEGARQVIKYLGIRPWQIPRLVLNAKRALNGRMDSIRIYPGMTQTIGRLQANGCQMYILSTNDPRNIHMFLKKNGLDDGFIGIYGDIGLRSKASALKKIVHKEKLDRGDCAYIGDEIRDVEAAKKAKVTSVGVIWGFNDPQAVRDSKPDILAQRPADLVKYLTS